MSDLFTKTQRQLQNEFNTGPLADRIVDAVVTEELADGQADFIHSRDMFYLATVDETGFPSCSYKGGSTGFVRVLDPQTLVFPNYDGNGMFMSMGNIEAQAKVGLLFIDFERPQRMRLRGTARCLRSGPLFDSYPGASLVVSVHVNHVWVNCPRYVHRMQPIEPSPYLPDEQGNATIALWKRVDLLQDVLSEADQAAAQALGLITIETYEESVAQGRLT